MLTLPELKALAKQNKIPYAYKNKDEIAKLLLDKNIITPSDYPPKIVRKHEVDQSRYEYLKDIRNNAKEVEVFDKKTGKITIFPSKYKTQRVLGINPFYIKDGTTWKNRYIITVN